MAEALPEYGVYAIKYATRAALSRDNFIGGTGDAHDVPMPLDYFVWVVKGPDGAIVVDTGFTEEEAVKRGRTFLRCPIDSLALLDVDADAVDDVILTHLHYDHVGNFHKFARAQFHLQEKEIHYAAGRHMRYPFLNHVFNPDDVAGIVRLNFQARVRYYNGPAELRPGITMHPVGGHSAGLQFVRVHTRRGWLVLASDVTHFFANMDRMRPFPAIVSTPEMMEGFDALREAAPSRNHIIPGHDPLVMDLYPPPAPSLEGIAVRLDAEPLKERP